MSEGVPVFTESTASQATLAQLRSRVYAQLRDTERAFNDEWYIDAMLNEGYLDLNARLRLNRSTATGVTHASTGVITLPTDCLEVTDYWLPDVGVQPELTSDHVFNSWANRGASPPAYLARVFAGTIETYPLVLSADYEIEYIKRPTMMVTDTDVPSVLHVEMEPRLISYAIAKAKWHEGEMQEGNQHMAMYEQGLPGQPRMTNAMRPAPMTMFPVAGPFDTPSGSW